MNNIRPSLKLLEPEQILQVHAYALRILSETGIRVDSGEVTRLLEDTGLVGVQDGRVKLMPDLVEKALRSAPSSIQIYDRNGQPAFHLGDDRLRFGVGVTALYYQEPEKDNLETFTRQHMCTLTRLGSHLPNYDVISTPGVVQDVHPSLSDLSGNLEMFANTLKPQVVLTSEDDSFEKLLDLFEHLHGDLGEKPFILPYLNPVTPLVLNAGTLSKMQSAIRRGLPFIFSNYSMAGASTPITPAGTLALLLAELLAGLTISQVMRPGTPIILGMLPAYFDLKTLQTFYDPQSMLVNLACAEIMAYYCLPHCGTSGSGTGWGMDLIASDSYWINTLTYALTRGGLAPFVGDSLGAKSISPCTLVNVNEVIEQALRFAGGFQLDDSQTVLDEIAKVGPGGSFLSAGSTLKGYRSGYYTSPLYPHWSLEKWQAQGQPSSHQVLREKTRDLIASLPEPEDYRELMAKGEAFIRDLSKRK